MTTSNIQWTTSVRPLEMVAYLRNKQGPNAIPWLRIWVEECRKSLPNFSPIPLLNLDVPEDFEIAVGSWCRDEMRLAPGMTFPRRADLLRCVMPNPDLNGRLLPKAPCRRCGGTGMVEVGEGAYPDGECSVCEKGVAVRKDWITAEVLGLAERILAGEVDLVRVLADAMQDAGYPITEEIRCVQCCGRGFIKHEDFRPKSEPHPGLERKYVIPPPTGEFTCPTCNGATRLYVPCPTYGHLIGPGIHCSRCHVVEGIVRFSNTYVGSAAR